MLKKLVTAGTSLALVAGMTVALTATPAMAAETATADPLSLAVAAADRAVTSGLDELTRGTFEQYDRQQVVPWVDNLYSVSYERTYRGLPVVGGDAVVLADGEGRVLETSTASSTSIDVPTTAAITADKAEATSKRELSEVDAVESRQLVVHIKNDKPRLAWETVLSGSSKGEPSHLAVYVDAATGKILATREDVRYGSGTGKWNGPNPLTITTSQSGSTYYMRDTTRSGLSCAPYNGSVYSGPDDNWGNGVGTSTETGCVDALYGAQTEWNMLSQWLGRNGHNGNNGSWPVEVGLNDQNAYWDGSGVTIGKNTAGEWISSMDVIGHEYGHGIDQFTPGGAGSQAGLGEATGDIFGALTEHFANQAAAYDPPDYLVGEEINLVGTGPIRNMYQPSLVNNDPNCYSSAVPGMETHKAAGPFNHWFYLLAEGTAPGGGKPNSPTCNSSTLTGVGIQTAGKIFYGGMLLKTSSMTYVKYRTATLQSAKTLDSTCGLFNKTKAAWDAITVPAQTADPTCTAGPGSDFSIALNPASGTVQPGNSVTSSVTTTAVGTAQTVNLTASVAGGTGVTAAVSPASVTSGGSATLTISAAAGTSGTRTVTVTGTGTTTHSVTYNLSIGTTSPGGPPDISVDNVKAHLQQLQTIASSNGGNRRAGSAGYTASVAYIKQKLQAAGYTVSEQACPSGSCTYPSNNLIAEWPQGDASQVYMLGAHLDGVSAGPGINDNGSGSAALLEVALTLAQKNPTLSKRIRFAWWTDEEQGLNGSDYYVNAIGATERAKIKSYLNFDMIGSTNGGYFINHVNSATATYLKEYWTTLGLAPEENTEGAGRSDDYSFEQAGIPTSGYAAGASARKTAAQVQKWGGTANAAYDACYHSSCDSYPSNINSTLLDRAADGIAYSIWKSAVSDTPPTNDFSIGVNPGSGSANAGASVATTVSTATTSGTAQTVNLAASAPSGITVSFNPASVTSGGSSTATISVAAGTAAGPYTVTITGNGSVSHSTTYSLTVNGTGGCSSGGNKIANGGFESGTTPWTGSTGAIGAWSSQGQPAHGGTRSAWLSGYGYTATDTVNQSVAVPAGCTTSSLSFWIHIDTDENEAVVYDRFTATVAGTVVKTLSNVDAASGYVQVTLPLGSYAGQSVTISLKGTEDASLQTSFVVDDVTFTVS